MGDQTGTLEPGKLADLIVVDGNPLDDIRILQQPEAIQLVMLGGQIVRDTLPARRQAAQSVLSS